MERPAPPTEQMAPSQQPDGNGWNKAQPQVPQEQMAGTEPQDRSLLQNLFVICLAVAVVFVVLTLVLAVLSQTVAAAVFLMIGLLAMVAALACMILSRRE